MKLLILLLSTFIVCNNNILAQHTVVNGLVMYKNDVIKGATITLVATKLKTKTDTLGYFTLNNVEAGKYVLKITAVGYLPFFKIISTDTLLNVINIALQKNITQQTEVVVTGTLKEVNRMESPVPVEVYSNTYFKKNPTSCIFDALQNVNGVRPQLNCNICNTGDIHINGLEGPYTMVLIDGMPLVSSLSTVYGLSGIPNSLIDRIEIVKGPASSLYGSEAVGGLINIITKNPSKASTLAIDVMSTSWLETNVDLGFKVKIGKIATILNGINVYNYGNIVDNNHDNFTDVTLQKRISVFQKWKFNRKENRLFNFSGRYYNENRWGGDVRWTKQYRGGDSIYGESIHTKRAEVMGAYQLPSKQKLVLSFSYNNHNQNSRYGTTVYDAVQQIAFAQLTWDKPIKKHNLLLGTAVRYTYYNDNTTATLNADKIVLPGIFIQNEITLNDNHKLLVGLRYDYHSVHKSIYTPRVAYKWLINQQNIIRVNAGTGFRVVNLFTEDHAALTGARDVVIKNELKPEKTYNINVNYLKKIYLNNGSFLGVDMSSWYTYFNNRIIADYDTDPNKILYDNLNGFAESKGVTTNIDYTFTNGIKMVIGATYMDVSTTNNKVKSQQILTEHFTATWAISYKIEKIKLGIDYTGNVYSPMRLPILGKLDPRQSTSPWWSIQNVQLVYDGFKSVELYGGVKNLLNFLPTKNNPFIIANTNDPFDKNVTYDNNGQVLATPTNPYALTFDPNYVYAPNIGIRCFVGLRFSLK